MLSEHHVIVDLLAWLLVVPDVSVTYGGHTEILLNHPRVSVDRISSLEFMTVSESGLHQHATGIGIASACNRNRDCISTEPGKKLLSPAAQE